ncbi:MAG: efflux RND transporter permease subunit [Steroidobacteraceae bacterium]
MRHTEIALRRPVTTWMAFAALAVIGGFAGWLLPLEQLPKVTLPFMGIAIPYPGSTPGEIEERITRPVEDALATLPGVKRIRSTSSADEAQLQIELDWGTDVRASGFEVRNKLDAIRHQLPPAANRILLFTASSADMPVLTVRLSASTDLSTQHELLDRVLKQPVERIAGVARVVLAGVEPRELRILLDAGRLVAHRLDVRELVALLERSNFSVTAGHVQDQQRRLLVRPLGALSTVAEVRELRVAPGLRLGDVASVDLVSPELAVRRNLDGRPAVGFDVFKSSEANVVDVVDRVLAVIEAARVLPQMQGITIFVIDDQARAIRQSLASVAEAGLLGAMLAILVLYLFLRDWPTTLAVSLAVPASLLVTLAVMYFLGISLNVLSMMGMMLAIGMLVDNAVVVTEAVFRRRQLQPGAPLETTLAGVREVGVAVLAGTATSVVVFLPVVLGERNQASIFLAHVAIPIVVALLASLLVAQTLIPMVTSRLRPPAGRSVPGIERLQQVYGRSLQWLLARRRRGALLLFVILAATVALLVASVQHPDRLLKIDMFPQDAARTLVLDLRIDGDHPIDRVAAAVATVEQYLDARRERLGIASVYSRFDRSSANLVLILDADRDAPPAREVMASLIAGMPPILIGQPTFDFDGDANGPAGIDLRLRGESTERLAALADEVARALRDIDGIATARSAARDGEREVRIHVDRERAAALGTDSRSVAQAVAAALRGDRLRELRRADDELTMRLAFRATDRQNIDDLLAMPLWIGEGLQTTLGAVATIRQDRAPRAIARFDRRTAVEIETVLDPGATLPAVRERITERLAGHAFPAGYSWDFGDAVELQDDTTAVMQVNLLLGLVMIFLVMAALFESTALPLSVLASITLGIAGTIWTLFLSGTTLTFMALIGVQILMGVIVNIGIVLVARINDLRQQGLPRTAAILAAGRDRLRPILMTTLTTVLGLLPLALNDSQLALGIGAPSYGPMAIALIGGLGLGAPAALLFVPVLYAWIDDAAAAIRRNLADALSATTT